MPVLSVGTFTLIKNEIAWIRRHLESWLPHVDEMVFFDGHSTDGTVEEISRFRGLENGHKIVLVEHKDPKDLQDDYVRLFNECLRTLKTDYAIFAHPDMILREPGGIRSLGKAFAYYAHMRNFAGNPGEQVFEVIAGRSITWKNIYRLRNPDLGLHYFGHYGAANEDCYFSKITGNSHELPLSNVNTGGFGANKWEMDGYPYKVLDSSIRIDHYSDVRPLERRIDRMYKCLLNQGYSEDEARKISREHPRVTLKDGCGVKFVLENCPMSVYAAKCPQSC
jgi:hypothetical protein